MAAPRASAPIPLPDWMSWENEYDGDDEATVAALVELVRYSREHRLAGRYPTDPAYAAALEAEAHLRGCGVCFLNTPEDACPTGKALEARRRAAETPEGGRA